MNTYTPTQIKQGIKNLDLIDYYKENPIEDSYRRKLSGYLFDYIGSKNNLTGYYVTKKYDRRTKEGKRLSAIQEQEIAENFSDHKLITENDAEIVKVMADHITNTLSEAYQPINLIKYGMALTYTSELSTIGIENNLLGCVDEYKLFYIQVLSDIKILPQPHYQFRLTDIPILSAAIASTHSEIDFYVIAIEPYPPYFVKIFRVNMNSSELRNEGGLLLNRFIYNSLYSNPVSITDI